MQAVLNFRSTPVRAFDVKQGLNSRVSHDAGTLGSNPAAEAPTADFTAALTAGRAAAAAATTTTSGASSSASTQSAGTAAARSRGSGSAGGGGEGGGAGAGSVEGVSLLQSDTSVVDNTAAGKLRCIL